MNLFKMLSVAVLAAGLSSTAFAADPVPSKLAGFYVEGNVGAGVPTGSADRRDASTVLGVVGGYKTGPLRFEGEYLKLGVAANNNNATTFGGRVNLGTVDVNLVGANVVIEPVTLHGFTPFVKVGVGYGVFGGSGSNGNSAVFNSGAGLSYAINSRLDLVSEYRYFMSDVKNTRQNDGSFDNFKQHVITAGIRYNF